MRTAASNKSPSFQPLYMQIKALLMASLDESVLPAALFKGLNKTKLDAYRGSMYSFFETQFGVRMLKAQEKLRAVSADAISAAILGVRTGEPLLAVDRVTLTYGDRPVEWRRGLCITR